MWRHAGILRAIMERGARVIPSVVCIIMRIVTEQGAVMRIIRLFERFVMAFLHCVKRMGLVKIMICR